MLVGRLEGTAFLMPMIEGNLLKFLVWMTQAKKVLEIGTYSGYSGMHSLLNKTQHLLWLKNFLKMESS